MKSSATLPRRVAAVVCKWDGRGALSSSVFSPVSSAGLETTGPLTKRTLKDFENPAAGGVSFVLFFTQP
jgi:hypothetical protein